METPTMQMVTAEVKPKSNVPEGVRVALVRKLCQTSLFYLGKHILGYTSFCSSQVEWDKWVRANVDLTGHTAGKFLILQPRETYKTSFFTVTLSIALIINNPELSILIVTERHDNGRDILKEIKRHFESNDKFRYLFGNLVKTDAWSVDQITLKSKQHNIKEPSIWIAGVGTAITGKHPDVIIADDIAGRKDKESEAGRQQTLSFFQDSWDLLKKEHGQYLLIGTRKHIQDIYWHVKENLNQHLRQANLAPFKVLEMPANEGCNPEGRPMFPRILPQEKLNELRVVKADSDGIDFATFMAEYELVPLDPKTQIFKQLHYVDHNGLKFNKLSQWTDPAMCEKKDSDYSAIVVIGRIAEGEHKNKRIVLYASIDKRPPTKLIQDHNRIYRMFHKQWPDVEFQINMENNGFQGLKDYAVDKSLQGEGDPVPTRGKDNTENKDMRISSLEPAISTGILLFREDWLTAPENYRLVIDQFKNYPQAKKDGPDATHGAYRFLNITGTQIR